MVILGTVGVSARSQSPFLRLLLVEVLQPAGLSSDAFGNRPMAFFAVGPRQQAVGLLVADDLLSLRVDVQRSAQAGGDVSQVDQGHRVMGDLDIGQFHLRGLSMGGSTAIGYALAEESRLLSLTLASTAAAGYDVSKKFNRLDRIARERPRELPLVEHLNEDRCRQYPRPTEQIGE